MGPETRRTIDPITKELQFHKFKFKYKIIKNSNPTSPCNAKLMIY